jgi:DNA-directed RNA polymerase specialized sigma24 family protein
MPFPETPLTLIQRLAGNGSEADWQSFLQDYWGPVCRFALRWGAGGMDEAEDAAAVTFQVLWQNQLLVRWVSNRSARLRTLLCAVVRNVLANRNRLLNNQRRTLHELAAGLEDELRRATQEPDAFYAAWVEDLIQRSVEALAAEYYRTGKGDYVRVLYGRLCQRLKIAEVAATLALKPSDVDNYFRHARDRLADKLRDLVRRQTAQYTAPNKAEAEFAAEWETLGKFLTEHGGLEDAVRRAFDLLDPADAQAARSAGLRKAAGQLTSVIRGETAEKSGPVGRDRPIS